MILPQFSIVQILVLLPSLVEGDLWCFKCDNTFHPAACFEAITCGEHESCYTDKHSNNNGMIEYSSGCRPIADCQTVEKRAATVHCTRCCRRTSLCNEIGCEAENHSNGTRLWCANCKNQLDPAACDQVNLCSQDESCSVVQQAVFGRTTFNLGCSKTSICTGKSLVNDKELCCDEHLCNTNKFGVSPDIYTPPPPTTTTPPPSNATATANASQIDFVSQHQPNETLQLTCFISGYPVPNVTWTFFPDVTTSNGTGGNDTTGNATAPVNATSGNQNATFASTSTTSATVAVNTTSLSVNTTSLSNITTADTITTVSTTSLSNFTSTTITAVNTTAIPPASVASVEITSGVITSGNTSTLVIASPNSTNAGRYVCHAENSQTVVEDSINVTFAAVPIIAGPANETLQSDIRNDVLLDCDVDGLPQPDVEWMYPPNAGGVEKLPNGSLWLHNVHGDNSGEYLCIANNTVGSAVKAFSLDVEDNSTVPCPTPAAFLTTTGVLTTLPATTLLTTATTQTTTTVPHVVPLSCPTFPTTSTTLTTTSPSTTASTTSSTTTPPSTTTSTTPSTTTSTTTTAKTMVITLTKPTLPPISVAANVSLFYNIDTPPATVLQCPPLGSEFGSWHWIRQEKDFDHANVAAYAVINDDRLMITPQNIPHNSTDSTGVYQCRTSSGPFRLTLDFVVYKSLPGNIGCLQQFDMGISSSPGLVFRVRGREFQRCGLITDDFAITCPFYDKLSESEHAIADSVSTVHTPETSTTCEPVCQIPVPTRTTLFWIDSICISAWQKRVIPLPGGRVYWILKNRNEVAFLKEENGQLEQVP